MIFWALIYSGWLWLWLSSCAAQAAAHSFTWWSSQHDDSLGMVYVWLPDNKDRNKNPWAETEEHSPVPPLNEYFFGCTTLFTVVFLSQIFGSNKMMIICRNGFIWLKMLTKVFCYLQRDTCVKVFASDSSKEMLWRSFIFNHCSGPLSSSSVSMTFVAAWWRQSVESSAGGSVCVPLKRKNPKW